MAAVISAIDKQSVHRICSGQVVLDLATAVKELVENSIDAGATSVAVNFKDNGLEGFEVIDDGQGVDPVNYESIALKHYTSKLSTFEDLESVMTFGFRGEALSSLCALCNITIITATKDQVPMGSKLEFDHNGKLISKTPAPRTMGTTVQLSNIFQTLPVRLQEFKRNIKREYNKALTILQAYSIISTNIRISVSNQSGKSYSRPSIKVISTSGNKEVTANISNIFGTKLTSQIMPFKINLTSIFDKGAVEGYISKPEWGIGRNSSDRQYFYVNGRPCMLPKMAKTLNEIYRTYISNQYPVLIVNFKIPTNAYDVNVSPDKRTIFIHEENRIVQCIMEQLQEQLEPSRSTFQMNALSPSKITLNIDSTPTNMQETTPSDNVLSNPEASSSPSNNRTLPTTPSSSSDSVKPFALENTALHKASFNSLKRPLNSPTKNILSNYVYKKPRLEVNSPSVSSLASDSLHAEQRNISVSVKATDSREFGSSEITATDSECNNSEIATAMTEPEINTLKAEEDNVKEYVETVVQIKSYSGLWKTLGRLRTIKPTNLNNFLQLHRQQSLNEDRQTYGDDNIDKSMNTTLKNAGIKNTDHNERATKALSRVITKSDFAEMKILGQFNLGFILTSLKDKDLYIIDQHASDEKYNFETLQQTTQIEGQKLISPPVLDLTVAEEHIVMDNLEIFKANGFEVEVLSENEPTQRICVLSQPVSKNTMFDKKDFSEIIHLINERPGEMVRCSRNRAMFASRACHRATRIGDVLTKRQMTTIIRHMGEIEQPWNCPHGRPTMRHLLNLSEYRQVKPKHQKRPLAFSGTLFNA